MFMCQCEGCRTEQSSGLLLRKVTEFGGVFTGVFTVVLIIVLYTLSLVITIHGQFIPCSYINRSINQSIIINVHTCTNTTIKEISNEAQNQNSTELRRLTLISHSRHTTF